MKIRYTYKTILFKYVPDIVKTRFKTLKNRYCLPVAISYNGYLYTIWDEYLPVEVCLLV